VSEGVTYQFDHVHIYCSDLAATEKWFVEGMGASVRQRMEAAGSSSAFLDYAGTTVILRSFAEGQQLVPGSENQYGEDHFGVKVNDLEAATRELKAKGVKFTMEPNEIRPGIKIAFVSGPDNIRIELLERKP
jgi:lactoylglutathione lyase